MMRFIPGLVLFGALSALPAAGETGAAIPLSAALQPLAEREGFILEMTEDAKALLVTPPRDANDATARERLLRGTSHVVIRDGDRIVRILVLGPEGGAPSRLAGTADGTAPPVPESGAMAEDRLTLAKGLAPDTVQPTGLREAVEGAMRQAERERATGSLFGRAAATADSENR